MTKDDHKEKIHQDTDSSKRSADDVVQNEDSLDCPGVDCHDQSVV